MIGQKDGGGTLYRPFLFSHIKRSYSGVQESRMSRRPYILSECTWAEVKERKIDLAILPWGACEAHNFHLPYGTDIYEADYITHESARKAYSNEQGFIVLPTIPFGVNTGQMDIFLDMNIYPSTQLTILRDVIEVLSNHGVSKLLVLNSHGGNNFKPLLRELGSEFPEMFLSFCDWFRSLDKSDFFEEEGDHADEMETSIIMHLYPDWVDLSSAGPGEAKNSRIGAIREGWAWAERQWSEVTTDTGVGNPMKANAQKGKNFLNSVTDKISQLIIELCQLDLENKYE